MNPATGSEGRVPYDFIVNTSHDLMSLVRRDYVYEAVSDSYCAAQGRTREEILGRTVAEVWGLETFERAIREHLDRCFAGGEVRYQATIRLAGEPRRFDVTYTPYRDPTGAVTHAVVVSRDITDLELAAEAVRASESKYRLLFESSPAFLCTHDLDGRLLSLNPAAAAMLGVAPEQARGRSIRDFVVPRVRDRFDDYLETIRARGRGEGLLTVARTDGGERDLLYHNVVVREAGSDYVLGHGQDVSDRIRAERELRAARDQAQEANRAKSRFLAAMSHEVRTPMNGVLGMIELVLGSELTAEQRERLTLARSSARALLAILNDLLDLSRTELGRIELRPVPFDLASALNETLAVLRLQAAERGLTLTGEIDPELPGSLRGDPDRIRQVIVNLVGNALKFTPEGGVRVELRVLGRDEGQARLRLTVADTGIGIPSSQLERIFYPFIQVQTEESRRYGGTGLGLAICARLVERMGGRIWAESEEGEGSRFHVELTLPLASPPAEEDAEPLTDPVVARRILLVEDNAVNRRLAVAVLERAGHRVTVAVDGAEALAAFRPAAFDLVLMDVGMPDLDGLEVTRRIRRRERQTAARRTPVVALTAHAMTGDRERFLAAGMDDHLTKPFRPTDLLRLVAATPVEDA